MAGLFLPIIYTLNAINCERETFAVKMIYNNACMAYARPLNNIVQNIEAIPNSLPDILCEQSHFS
ncbi:hypothetical protein J2W57_001806 [Chryseobacterium ginsenosidimutans]|uniref:Uncharacterized protein n=1 Tax=Chryseobacterium geocarposphaerae TaxID=1416776 RepID=A0ABU1LBF4_9FLAO|nr:hypothetical protein [Chryseobacterium geocarposphaerae]MDR6698434.1 hypothetical protein [Chryseobacterium ginsenosidimutans]